MSWRIDSEGIHIDASCLEVVRSEWRLTCEPRTVAEKNAMNTEALFTLVAGMERTNGGRRVLS